MVSTLLGSRKLNLAVWEPYVPSRATKAQSLERRWQHHGKSPNCSHGNLHPVSASRLERVKATTVVFSVGYDDVVGVCFAHAAQTLLHDPLVGSVVWSNRSRIVAGTQTGQRRGIILRQQMGDIPSGRFSTALCCCSEAALSHHSNRSSIDYDDQIRFCRTRFLVCQPYFTDN